MSSKIKILFLAAVPNDKIYVNIVKEGIEIQQTLNAQRDKFEFIHRNGISKTHFRDDLEYNRPNILHFSGHDSPYSSLVFQDGDEISSEQLEKTFKSLSFKIYVVFLNGCYSKRQARVISKYVDYIIGTKESISDDAAIIFSSQFYKSLLKKIDYKEAYEDAIAYLSYYLESESSIPKLIVTHGLKSFKKINSPFQNKHLQESWLKESGLVMQNLPRIDTSSSLEIEKYPYARFPDKVVLYDTIPLEVVIKSFIKPTPHYTTSIKLLIDDTTQKEIPIQVIVECDDDGFEIVGKYYATINVPVTTKESNPIIFNVKSTKEGKHTIHIRFYQRTTYVGDIKLESIVTTTKNQRQLFLNEYLNRESKSDYVILDNVIPGPDITIFIHERKVSIDFEYDILVSSLDIPIQEMGPIKFKFNPETKFHKIFEDIENLNAPYVTIIDRKIRAKGMSLYDELFPELLKQLYWEKHDKIKSIRVISKEPWIPWEIIKPWHKLKNGNIEEDPFLCENYAFSRWLIGKNERFKTKIKSIKLVIPEDTNLDAALKERDWIEKFVKQRNIKISCDSSYDQVINTLETEKKIDVIHFSTHGQNNKENPLLSIIELEGNVQLRPEEIVGKAMTFGQSHPIVILNACQTGNQGFSLTGIQGWATKFLDAGASVFIGTLWSVNDETALNFIVEFYNQLASGLTLGESVKNARNNCKKEGDTSWLAYQLYGHPNYTIKF